jgi:hypothetical protein
VVMMKLIRKDEWHKQLIKWKEQGLEESYFFVHRNDNTKVLKFSQSIKQIFNN